VIEPGREYDFPPCPECGMPSRQGPTIEILAWARRCGMREAEKRIKFALVALGVSDRIIKTAMGE